MSPGISKFKQHHELLRHILDQPELPAIIQSLDAGVLTRLIRHVGLEDSAEIVALATMEQLKDVFDEDLWYSETPGREDVFDADRFGLWLEIMIETGAAFAAQKIMDLDEDLVTLALNRLILVVDFDEMAIQLSSAERPVAGDMLDKVLESTLNQEFDAFIVIARNHARWEAVQALLAELNELDYGLLSRLLERCCRISWEYIDDNGGLYNVLTTDEMLEADMAADREARRANKGFVSGSIAVSFLNLTRSTPMKTIIASKDPDYTSRTYCEASGRRAPDAAAENREQPVPADNANPKASSFAMSRFLKTLQQAEVLPAFDQKRLGQPGEISGHHLPLVKAMRLINRTDPDLYAQRLTELTYLSNVLMSGCGFQGRAFRPVEAAEAAFSVCNLGSAYLLGSGEDIEENQLVKSIAGLVGEHHLVKLFQVGWKLLYENVVLFTAEALMNYFDRIKADPSGFKPDAGQAYDFDQLGRALESCVAAGRPWEFHDQLDNLMEHLVSFMDGASVAALAALLREYPTLSVPVTSEKAQTSESTHIWSLSLVHTVRKFIRDVFHS